MKIRFSLLNVLFLLMFWGPFISLVVLDLEITGFSSFYRRLAQTQIGLLPPTSTGDHGVHFWAILSVSFWVFIFLTLLYIFFDFWGKLGYWKRYGLMIAICVLTWILIYHLAFEVVESLGITTSSVRGSPLLLSGIFFFYIPLGFIWTLIVWIFKRDIN